MKKYFSKTTGTGLIKNPMAVSHFLLCIVLHLCMLVPRVTMAQPQFIKTYLPGNCPNNISGNLTLHCITKTLNPAITYYIAGVQDKNVYVAEVDASGTVLQEKLVAVNSADYTLRSMITDAGGNLVIVGTSTVANPYKSFLMTLSPALSLLLHHTYNNVNLTGQSQMVFCDVKDPGISNSNYYISGGARDFNNATASDVLLIAVDKSTGGISNTYQGDATRGEDLYDALVVGPNANGTTGLFATGRLGKVFGTNSGPVSYRPWINRHTTAFAFTGGARYLAPVPQTASLYSSSLITDNSFLLYAWTGNRTGINYGLQSGLGKYNVGSLAPVWQRQYSFTPVPPGQNGMLLNKIATDPNGYVAEGNWWNGTTGNFLTGTTGEMILLRTDKLGVPVWSRKIINIFVNSATHNAAFVIDGSFIFAVGYTKLPSSGLLAGALVKIPLLNGALDTLCATPQTVSVRDTSYYTYDSIYSRPPSPVDSTNYFAINCTTTDTTRKCGCISTGPQLNADFNLTGSLLAGNNYYTVSASGFTTSANSKWIVSETSLTPPNFPDIGNFVYSVPAPSGPWGSTLIPCSFWGYYATPSPSYSEQNSSFPSGRFLAGSRYRFRHILSYTNNCGIIVSDTVTKAIMMCTNCRTANGNGFIIETERSSSNDSRNTGSTTQISYTGGLKVVPNPVQAGIITVGYPQANSGEVQISIADMQGKKVLEKSFARNTSNGRFTMDVSRLINGTYTVTLLNNGASVTQKLVVAR